MIMDKYYITIAYSIGKGCETYKVTILGEDGRDAAIKALHKLVEKSEPFFIPAIEIDEESIAPPPVLVTQGGFGDGSAEEDMDIERDYLAFFSVFELLDEIGYPEYYEGFVEMYGKLE